MKSAMKELIDWIDKCIKEDDAKGSVINPTVTKALYMGVKSAAIGLFEKEKEQIMDAYGTGYYHASNGKLSEINMTREEYYNETFPKKTPIK